MTFGGYIAGSTSFAAAGSGGPPTDFGLTGGAGGAGMLDAGGVSDGNAAGSASARAVVAGGLSPALSGAGAFSAAAAELAASGATAGAGVDFCAIVDVSGAGAVAGGASEGGLAGLEETAATVLATAAKAGGTVAAVAAPCEGADVEFCRATAPVTDSRPCSSAARRE